MPSEPPITKPDIVAVRDHTVRSGRTSAHVIVCHDLNRKSHALYEMFNFADRVSPVNLDALARDLAHDIIEDVNVLVRDLQEIKDWAHRQIDQLDKIQDGHAAPPKGGKTK